MANLTKDQLGQIYIAMGETRDLAMEAVRKVYKDDPMEIELAETLIGEYERALRAKLNGDEG